jgi:hypothetical protein
MLEKGNVSLVYKHEILYKQIQTCTPSSATIITVLGTAHTEDTFTVPVDKSTVTVEFCEYSALIG